MTTLYRSPNIIIGEFEWHIVVRKTGGRITTTYFWRPLSLRKFRWLPITSWKGAKPGDLCNRMWPFRIHVQRAMDSDKVRMEAISRLAKQRTQSAMATRNVGQAA